MIPTIFAAGEAREIAIGKLTEAGYSYSPISDYATQSVPCGDSLCARVREDYTDFFRKPTPPVSILSLACNVDYVVWLSFDSYGRSIKAQNELYC
jgi:hypothetical protein